MSRELICAWLKITADAWPPDHYTLLGLEPAEADAARIERHVHQRHETLMRYQLTHPEAVTEAMNRLAQAFDCLSDPASKRSYDTAHFPDMATAPTPLAQAPSSMAMAETAPPREDPLAWLFVPWSQGTIDTGAAPTPLHTPAARLEAPPPTPAPPPPPIVEELDDPVVEAAAHSTPARRGLGTKRSLYYRISRTRQLLRAWVLVGNTVGDPAFVLTKKADAVEMVRQLTAIRQLLQNFPPLLGQAGQPGYSVVALARQQMIVQTYLGLLPSQREMLTRDWQKGLELLAAHRRFLREELSVLRRKGRLGRTLRATHALLVEHPGVVLLLTALISVNLVYAPLLAMWPVQAAAVGIGLCAAVLLKTRAVRRSWLERTQRSPRRARPVTRPQRQTR